MPEAEKQEGQKTVVAFITGLLIGGLLVWVFSSSPAESPSSTPDDATNVESNEGGTSVTSGTTGSSDVQAPVSGTQANVGTGTGALKVSNQKAGKTVAIEVTSYPAKDGWVVVRDYKDGIAGKILGAARFGLDEGLKPTEVGLLRSTVAGSEYQVSFYSQDAVKEFSTTGDKPLAGGEVNFKAE